VILGPDGGETRCPAASCCVQVSASTRLEVVTEGILLRRLQQDPELQVAAPASSRSRKQQSVLQLVLLASILNICVHSYARIGTEKHLADNFNCSRQLQGAVMSSCRRPPHE